MAPPHELGDHDSRPGAWFLEVCLVNGVTHSNVAPSVRYTCTLTTLSADISRCFEDGANVVQGLLHFGFEIARNLTGIIAAPEM